MSGHWIEVFKTGTHVSSNGVKKTYTEDDLKNIADMYNQQSEHEAPLVIGHPKTDDPAFGWGKKLKAAGEKLFAYVDQLHEDVIAGVNNGHYKKVSIALYPNGLLRHIGLLGAVPPAVKGLAPVQFAQDSEYEEYITLTAEWRMPYVARLFGNLRDFLIEKFGVDSADKAVPKYDIDFLRDEARDLRMMIPDTDEVVPVVDKPEGVIANFNEEEEKEMDELKALVKSLEDKLSKMYEETDKKIQDITAIVNQHTESFAEASKKTSVSALKTEFAAFCETLVQEGKVYAAEKDSIVEEYAVLLAVESKLEFNEAEIKPSEMMKKRLEARPVLIQSNKPFAVKPAASTQAGAPELPSEYSDLAPRVDMTSLEIDQKIRTYAESNKVTYEQATQAIMGAR